MDEILDALLALEAEVESDNEEKAQTAANRLDSLLKSLGRDALEEHSDVLTQVNERLITAIAKVKIKQRQTREDIVKFSSNTSKLKAYQIPR